jgi:hypothetical protein
MGLLNLNFESAVRGVLDQKAVACDDLLKLASDKLVECGLSANLGKAHSKPLVHGGRRNPLRGQPMGSENFNGRSLNDWVLSIPAVVPAVVAEDDPEYGISKEVAAAVTKAHEQLVALHATVAVRSPETWAKIQAAQKAAKPAEPAPLV